MMRSTRRNAVGQYKFGQPPLSKSFGALPREKKVPADSGVKTSTLSNGAKVVTHDKDGGHTALGFYITAGPKMDPLGIPGMSYVMRFAMLTSNFENSLFQIDRTMRSTGFAYGHGEIRKKFLTLKAEGRRDLWQNPFQNLATCVSAPRFHESDIERFRDTMDNLLQEQRWQKPRDYVVDQLETVAFFKEPLGNPRMVPSYANDKASSTALMNQYASLFVPSNVTVAAVNVNHDELVAAYESLQYPHSASAPHHANAPKASVSEKDEAAQFHPGRMLVEYENRAKELGTRPDMEDDVAAAAGWLANGRDESLKSFAASTVFSEAFAAALHEGARYNHQAAQGLRSFYRPFASTGLVGFTAHGAPADVPQMLRDGAALMPKQIDETSLAIAKARAMMRFQTEQLEVARDYADFLGTSSNSAEETFAAIQGVTVADVKAIADRARAAKPALFATGKTLDFPSYEALKL
jgi:mitochondrial-processing peptidase subunit alpha